VTLNDLVRRNSFYLRYFTEYDSFQAGFVTVVEDRPILSAEYRLPYLSKTDPPCSAVSAIAELLVNFLTSEFHAVDLPEEPIAVVRTV